MCFSPIVECEPLIWFTPGLLIVNLCYLIQKIKRSLAKLRKEICAHFRELPRYIEQKKMPLRREPQTLRQLSAPNLTQAPLAIQYPEIAENVAFELKSGLVHLLPTFHGLNGENPIKHLAEFDAVCTSMKPRNVTEDQIKLRAFPFSLKDKANDWFYNLGTNSITTWNEMKQAFLEKFFPSSKLNELKRAISSIEQGYDENLYEYVERFKRLLASCPYHGYDDKDIVLYLFGGLLPDEKRMVNAACGGNIETKTPDQAMALIIEFVESSRTYSKRCPVKGVKAASSDSQLESEVYDLKSMFRQFMVSGKQQQVKACGI